MRPVALGLLLGGLVGCAGAKDMSRQTDQSAGAAVRPEPDDMAKKTGDAGAVAAEADTADMSQGTVAGPTTARGEVAASPASQAEAAASPERARGPGGAALPAELLGRSRADIEAQLGRLQFTATGWASVAEHELLLGFSDDRRRCVRIRGPVPEAMDCMAVATWLGYGPDAYPLRRADSCEWPGISLKHRLAAGVAGRYVPATREFEIWLRD